MSTTSTRLSRESIIECALRISEKNSEQAGEPVTGKSLGDALRVDRSAVWRHFEDKDDLLLAVADQMIALVRTNAEGATDPRDTLERIFFGFMEVFARYPFVGALLGPRYLTQENALLLWEQMLAALRQTGLSREDAMLHYRMFADTAMALAAVHAQLAQRPAEEAEGELRRLSRTVRQVDPTDYPVFAEYSVAEHVGLTSDTVARRVFDSLWTGVEAALERATVATRA